MIAQTNPMPAHTGRSGNSQIAAEPWNNEMDAVLSPIRTYQKLGSVFTVSPGSGPGDTSARPWEKKKVEPNEQSFDLAVIMFKDDGSFVDQTQLKDAVNCIADARENENNPNGAVVVVFMHGWHHDATWDTLTDEGDAHFRDYRRILMTLALREAERYDSGAPKGRRVIGIYLAWNGDPANSWRRCVPILQHTTFWNRYAKAKKIAAGIEIRKATQEIIKQTKGTIDGKPDLPDSPLILVGHSMGALILEKAFLELLKEHPDALIQPFKGDRKRPVEITCKDQRVTCPDLVLLLNSAADSRIASEVATKLKELGVHKKAVSDSVSFLAPVLVSMTSPSDTATRFWWRLANPPWRKTEGHDRALFTHKFGMEQKEVICNAKVNEHFSVSFGQAWHCLRYPNPRHADLPSFPIDLPGEFPLHEQVRDKSQHSRYVVRPLEQKRWWNVFGHKDNRENARVCWIFRVPPKIIADHNDVFNFRSRLLTLALMQICGAVMSLATTWDEVFEEEPS